MSILPRFPPFNKLRGRDYNLICDTVESYLSSLSQTNTTGSSTTLAGVSKVLAGSGVAVAPTTGNVVITKTALDAFPYATGGSASSPSGTAPTWTTWPVSSTDNPPELVGGYFTPLVNNSIWTFIMWTDFPITFEADDSPFDLRLTKNGTEMVHGTTQLVSEGDGVFNGIANEWIYNYSYQLVTTQILQVGDQINVQISAPNATNIQTGLSFDYIRWA